MRRLERAVIVGLERWVLAVARAPYITMALVLSFTVACAFYTVRHISVNTDTSEMIGENVAYRAELKKFTDLFPLDDNAILVVIDGASAEASEAAAAVVRDGLAERRDGIEHVFWPAGDPHFRRNGLLYLEVEALAALSDKLADAEPLLARLRRDASLRGLTDLVEEALTASSDGGIDRKGLAVLFAAVRDSIAARLDGAPRALSWRGLLAGEDAAAADSRQLLLVKTKQDFSALRPVEAGLKEIRAVIAAIPEPLASDVTIRLTGEAMLTYEEISSVSEGAALAAVVSLVLLALLLVWGLRSPWLATIAFAALVIGLIWTAGFAVVAVGRLNLISVAFAVLFVGLCEDFVIHFALRFREAVDAGKASIAALGEAAQGAGSALLFLAVAAATGFLAFVPTAYAGFAELGIIAGAGMFIGLFATLTVMPAMLGIRAPKRRQLQPVRLARLAEQGLRRRAKTVVAVALLLAVAMAATMPLLRFDEDPLNLKAPESPSVLALRDLEANGDLPLYPVEFILDDIRAAEDLAARAEAVAGVDRAVTLADFVPAEQDEKLQLIDDMSVYLQPALAVAEAAPAPTMDENRAALRRGAARIAAERRAGRLDDIAADADSFSTALAALADAPDEAVAAASSDIFATFPALIERLAESLRAGPVEVGDLPRNIRARWLVADGRARVQVIAADDEGRGVVPLRAFVDAMQALDARATGPAVASVGAGRAVTTAMIAATVYAICALGLLLLFVLRNAIDMLLVLIPLVLAGLYAAGTAVLLNMPFNFANVIVLPLILGLALAGCGHMLLRAREEKAGGPLFETSTPWATLLAAVSTVMSFGSLSLSAHPGTRSMGILLSIAIAWSLACTLLLMPALLELRHRGRDRTP